MGSSLLLHLMVAFLVCCWANGDKFFQESCNLLFFNWLICLSFGCVLCFTTLSSQNIILFMTFWGIVIHDFILLTFLLAIRYCPAVVMTFSDMQMFLLQGRLNSCTGDDDVGYHHRRPFPFTQCSPWSWYRVCYCQDRSLWWCSFPRPRCIPLLACLPDADAKCKSWLPGRGWSKGRIRTGLCNWIWFQWSWASSTQGVKCEPEVYIYRIRQQCGHLCLVCSSLSFMSESWNLYFHMDQYQFMMVFPRFA